MDLTVLHTGLLDTGGLDEARALLEDVFAGELTDEDWEHCLGGLHALLRVDGVLVAHAALVQRRLLHGGRVLRAGYVEGVAVRADARRQGHGGAVMAALEAPAGRAYDVTALATTDDGAPFYAARGWQTWRGPTGALTPDGVVATPEEDGAVLVLPTGRAPLDLDGRLVCDWREGDVW